jgi:DNA (cytosine-5)-methyltransferase 1
MPAVTKSDRLHLVSDRANAEMPVVSLFTGAGGLDLGLDRAGNGRLSIRACVEIDDDARDTLNRNRSQWGGGEAEIFSDIRQIQPGELMAQCGLATAETFLLAGGPPCQSFSSAGQRKGFDGTGEVVNNYFEMVKELQPRFFVFENVRGLLSAALRHRPLTNRAHPQEIPSDKRARLGSVMDLVILPAFKKLGYEVIYGLLNAADYGTAQVRHRVFLIGSRDREFQSSRFRKQTSRSMNPLDLVPPTHHRLAPYEPIQPWRTLQDAISDLPRDPQAKDTYTYSKERAGVFARIPAGSNWTYVRSNPRLFPKGHLEKIMGKGLQSGGGKEGYWRRLSWDRPAPTLTAQPQQLATSLCHPEADRPLSIPEYAALQDFPPNYLFEGSKSSRYRQIGNAVPVRLAEAIGKSLLAVANANLIEWPSRKAQSRIA